MEIHKGGLILRIFRNNSTPCLHATTNPYVAYVSVALMTPFDNESLDIISAHVAKRLGIGPIVAPGQNTGITLINSDGSVQLDVQTASNGIPYLDTHSPETLVSSGIIDICTGRPFDLAKSINRVRIAFPRLLETLANTEKIVEASDFLPTPPRVLDKKHRHIRSFDQDASKDRIADAYVQANITKSVYLTSPVVPSDSSASKRTRYSLNDLEGSDVPYEESGLRPDATYDDGTPVFRQGL